MMGVKNKQKSLFAYNVDLDQRIRPNHPLRKVKSLIDFTFVRKRVAHLYGHNGNESIDPEVILKMMFLLFFDNIASDTYTCPAGKILTRRKNKAKRQAYEYSTTREECAKCVLRSQCTRADIRSARTIKRHYEQELLDVAIKQSMSYDAHKDRVRRKWLMEGSFADAANNHGFKRSRWRRLHKQQIQDYLIATIQNIRILIKHGIGKSPVAVSNTIGVLTQILVRIFVLFGNHHPLRLN